MIAARLTLSLCGRSSWGKRWKRYIDLMPHALQRQKVQDASLATKNSWRDGAWATAGVIDSELWRSLHAQTRNGDRCRQGCKKEWRVWCEQEEGDDGAVDGQPEDADDEDEAPTADDGYSGTGTDGGGADVESD